MGAFDDRNVVDALERIATALEHIAATLAADAGQYGPGVRLKGLPDLAPKPTNNE